MTASAPTWRTAVVLGLLSTIWGTQHLVIRTTQPNVAPALAVALRFLALGVIAEVVCRVRGHRVGRAHLGTRGLFGGMHALSMVLLYAANGELPTALVGLLVATTPLFVTLAAPLLLPDEAFGLRQLGACLLGVLGIATLSVSELGVGGTLLGISFGLGAAFTSALSRVASKRLVLPFPAPVLLRDLGVVSGLTAGLIWFAQGSPGAAPDEVAWAGIAYLAIVGSAIASGVYFHILRRVPVSRLSYQMLVTALVATFVGTVIHSEPFGISAVVGTALVLAGLALTVSAREDPRSVTPAGPVRRA